MLTKNIPAKLSVLAAILILLGSSIFFLDEREQAVIFQFGKAVSAHKEPGVKFKLPLIQTVKFFDKRVLNIDAEAQEIIASDQKRIIVDAFARYVITEPVTFFTSVGSVDKANKIINSAIESSLRQTIGRVPLITLLSVKRSEIMQNIKEFANDQVKRIGVSILDVRILRADLPKENSSAIFRRMKTDREKEAREIRAQGSEEASKIRAKAESDSRIIIAEAKKKATIFRGVGESKAAEIFNAAFEFNEEFFIFIKTLSAYENSFKAKDTKFIISSKAKFLENLKLK